MHSLVVLLGTTAAPKFTCAAAWVLPRSAVRHTADELKRIAKILPVCSPHVCQLCRVGDLLWHLQAGKAIVHAIDNAFKPILVSPLPFPGFNEHAQAYLWLLNWVDTSSPYTIVRNCASFAEEARNFDVSKELGKTPFAAWGSLSGDEDDDGRGISQAIALVKRLLLEGDFEFEFFPANFDAGSEAVVIISFCIYGVHGALIAQEPFVEPSGHWIF